MRRSDLWWAMVLVSAASLPFVTSTPFFLSTATVALTYVALGVAYDLVVGRVGALSLAQPVFLGFGAYSAAILATQTEQGFLVEAALAVVGSMALAVLIGIPAFRLNLHAFAIATLAFAVTAYLVAHNWFDVTGGATCITGIPPLTLRIGSAELIFDSPQGLYWLSLGIAGLTVALVMAISRLRLGLALTAVRDDPVLASARGLWPTELRLLAFAISAGLTGLVGVFLAHHQRVICPNTVDLPYTVTLLIIVFIGGRASLRGVVTAAVLVTVVPQVLRITAEWRLAIFGVLLLLVVTTFPDGLEHAYRAAESRWKRIRRRSNAKSQVE